MGETSIQVEDLNLFKICQKENYLNVTHNPTSSKKKVRLDLPDWSIMVL